MSLINNSKQFNRPSFLKKGDRVCILSPAKGIDAESINLGADILKSWGLVVEIGKHSYGAYKFYSGTDQERASDFAEAASNPNIKAIFSSRGGYGSIRTLKELGNISINKWIIGFSDITVFHAYCNLIGLESIHGAMPITFKNADKLSLESLKQALFGELTKHEFSANALNRIGIASGRLVGGNLSVLYSLMGTPFEPTLSNSILFLEDTGEDFYSIDRMLMSFVMSKKLSAVKGIIIGHFSNCIDSENRYNTSINELIFSNLEYLNIPIAFNFPSGHIEPNVSMYMGRNVELIIKEEESKLIYI